MPHWQELPDSQATANAALSARDTAYGCGL
jgi:hypothetical protein